ncbi:MAG: hypothetical protein ACQERJ_05610 [Bacillota bacterium]
MRNFVILSVVFSLIIIYPGSVIAGTDSTAEVVIKFPTKEANFNINPVQGQEIFIPLQIKNIKQPVVVKLDLKTTKNLQEIINYQIQDNKNQQQRKYLKRRVRKRGTSFVIEKNYSGWIKLEVASLKKWWQVEAGSYRVKLKLQITELEK